MVFKNDEKTVDEIASMNPKGVMVSPGPGRPEDSGISLEAVEKLGPEFGVFGVCMGHQCIGQVFGGNIVRAPCGLMHGKSSPVWHTEDDSTMLHGLTSPFQAARYHSLVIDRDGFPDDELEVTAWTEDETIMAVKHRRYPKIQGVQFHPESIITENGLTIIRNWVALINAEPIITRRCKSKTKTNLFNQRSVTRLPQLVARKVSVDPIRRCCYARYPPRSRRRPRWRGVAPPAHPRASRPSSRRRLGGIGRP